MFENRVAIENAKAAAATMEPSANGNHHRARPSRNGANGDAVDETAGLVGSDLPSTNGMDGGAGSPLTPGPSLQGGEGSKAGRQSNGRFAKGNPGGPGNPFARQTAELRQALLNRTSPADIEEIAGKLIEQAKAGDVQSAKVVFQYTIGKPQPAPNPDHLDVEEWQGYQREALMFPQVKGIIETPAPELPLDMVRIARPSVTASMGTMVANLMRATPEEGREFLDRAQAMPKEQADRERAKVFKPLDVSEYVHKAREKESRRERRARLRKERAAAAKGRPSPNGGKR